MQSKRLLCWVFSAFAEFYKLFAEEFEHIGRAAVSAAVLGAADPGRAARELRTLLAGPRGD